ncbi:MAG: hypothetical protein AB9873_21110 [Syntrophobacteraceae bacterium]
MTFVFMALAMALTAHAQVVGPVDGVTGFPAWLRDTKGIQLQLCDQGGGVNGLAPCPSLTPATATAGSEAMFYNASAGMGDPVEFPNAPIPPNGELFLGNFFLEAAGIDPTLPLDPLENAPLVINGGRIRLRNLVVPGTYTVQTPVGTFTFDAAPGVTEIDELLPTNVDALAPFNLAMTGPIQRFRGNGTGSIAVPPDFTPPAAGLPGFIGNGVDTAPLIGGGTFAVVGPPGSGINVSTTSFAVEGKVYTTLQAAAGGLVVERGTMTGGGRATGVLFAQTNVLGGSMEITSIAGVTQIPPLAMIADVANPGRFFRAFPMGNLTGETEVGMAVTVRDALGAPAAGLEELPHIMQDTVSITSATYRAGRLTVNAASSVPGTARAPGARLTVQSVPSMDPLAVGVDLGAMTGRSFSLAIAPAPAFIRVRSSLGGSLSVPVKTTPPAGEIIAIRSATFSQRTGALTVQATSSVRGAALTADSVDAAGAVISNLGALARNRLVVPNLTAPPSYVRVSSAGASMTVPVTIK